MTTAVAIANKAIRSSLVLGGVTTLVIAVVGGYIGWTIAGWSGLVSALLGALIAFVFMGVTAASILLGQKLSGGSISSGAFFATVLGAWLLKFVLFLGAIFLIKNVTVLQPVIALVCVIAAVIGALVSDVIAVSKARVPVVDMIGS